MKPWSNLTAKDLYKGVVNKLSLESTGKRRAREPIYWYLMDEKRQLKVAMPNIHGGSGSMTIGYLKQIRKALKLSTREFEELVDCLLTAKDFETIIRERLDL